MTVCHPGGMSLRDRIHAAAVLELERVAAQIAGHAPHRDVRQSIVAPPPEELPAALARVRSDVRLGQPDIQFGERTPPSFLFKRR